MHDNKCVYRLTHCVKHGDFEQKGLIINGKPLWLRCPMCQKEKDEEDKKEDKRSEAYINRLKYQRIFGQWLPKAFDYPLESFEVLDVDMGNAFWDANEFVINFSRYRQEGLGLFLTGRAGTGKTKIACGILKKFYPEVVGCYVTLCGLGDLVRQTWGRSKDEITRYTETELIRAVYETPLLVLDEIGTINKDHDGELLFKVIDTRYSNLLPTICISNLSLAGLTNLYGERLSRRIEERNRIIVFDWMPWHQRQKTMNE